MELEELKSSWAELDRRIAANQDVNRLMFKVLKQDRLQSALKKVRLPVTLELAVTAVCFVALMSFIVDHWGALRSVLSGLSLGVFLVMTAIGNLRENSIIQKIDFDSPVIVIQRQLAVLKSFRLRLFQGKFLLGMLLWPIFVIVITQGVFRIDPYTHHGASILAILTGCNLVIVAALVLLAPHLPKRLLKSRAWAQCVDALSGEALSRTATGLDEIAQFECE